MFSLSQWLIQGIKVGFRDGTFAFCKVTELTAGYLSKGLITEAQAEDIALACPAPVEPEGNAESEEM